MYYLVLIMYIVVGLDEVPINMSPDSYPHNKTFITLQQCNAKGQHIVDQFDKLDTKVEFYCYEY